MTDNQPSIPGYLDYQRREYCRDIQCPLQLQLEQCSPGSEPYERIRAECVRACRHTTYQFHHWLIQKGYLVVRKSCAAAVDGTRRL